MNQDKRPAYAPHCFGFASAFGADEDICGQCRAAAECGPIAKDNLAELSKLIDVSHVVSMHSNFIAESKKPEASSVPAMPKPDPSAVPFRRYGAATPKEMAEINAILAEVGDNPEPDDLPSAALSNNTAHGPKKPETATVPALPKPKPSAVETESNGFREYAESGDLDAALFIVIADSQPIEVLLERYQGLFSDDSPLSPDKVTLADKIAEELTKRGKPPSERGVSAFDKTTCKKSKTARFKSNRLQVHDQQWIQARYPGHPTKSEAWGGIFAEIFAPGPFNRDRAMKISEFNRGPAEKVKCLNLSESQQRELVVLRGKEEDNRRYAVRKKELRQARANQERLLQIERDAVEVRCRLTEYKARTPRARLDIDEHVMVWRCLSLCEGQGNYVAGAMREYEKLTGGVNSRASFREKINKLESILAGSTLIKWRG